MTLPHSCPADFLVTNGLQARTAAFDFTLTSHLNTLEVGVSVGSVTLAAIDGQWHHMLVT